MNPGASPEPPDGRDGPIAEYVALRQEMNSRAQIQHNIIVTQLTVAGAVFGFVLGTSGRTILLLIVPVSSYLLCARHVAQTDAIHRIRRYLREELHQRIPGGLMWDWWNQANPRQLGLMAWLVPLLLAFPGVSLVALLWAASSLATSPPRLQDLGIWAVIGLDAVGVFASVALIMRQHLATQRQRRELRVRKSDSS